MTGRLTAWKIASPNARGAERPPYELLPPDTSRPNLGLAALPPATPSDIFFDMEGFPLLEDGLEYLFGVIHLEGDGPIFRDWWALSHREERAAFEGFVQWAMALS
jgi:predicted RecB family nuclease